MPHQTPWSFMPETASPAPTRVRYLVLTMLFVATTLNFADRATLSIAGPAAAGQLGLNAIEMGYVFSAFGWAYVIGQIPGAGRLTCSYHCSAATLNLCRAFTAGGYADLHQAHGWNQDFVRESPAGQHYERLAEEIDRALAFMRACGANPAELRSVELYTSHEALLLDYEKALTRSDPGTGLRYGASAHFLWIGERTRALDGAHVDFARDICNPVGVKLGPSATPAEVLALAEALNPSGEPGRLTFISRMGAARVRDLLPPLVRAVARTGMPVAWVCDPMHGNTFEAPSGHKTRRFDDVLAEVHGFFDVHRD